LKRLLGLLGPIGAVHVARPDPLVPGPELLQLRLLLVELGERELLLRELLVDLGDELLAFRRQLRVLGGRASFQAARSRTSSSPSRASARSASTVPPTSATTARTRVSAFRNPSVSGNATTDFCSCSAPLRRTSRQTATRALERSAGSL
jgi:hypothetical protein